MQSNLLTPDTTKGHQIPPQILSQNYKTSIKHHWRLPDFRRNSITKEQTRNITFIHLLKSLSNVSAIISNCTDISAANSCTLGRSLGCSSRARAVLASIRPGHGHTNPPGPRNLSRRTQGGRCLVLETIKNTMSSQNQNNKEIDQYKNLGSVSMRSRGRGRPRPPRGTSRTCSSP